MIRPNATLTLALLLALSAWPAAAAPAISSGEPRLAFRRLAGAVPSGPVLAQRSIDREWGPSDDSIYVEVELPGWKSEPLAAALSAALPGAGQMYVGESNGWVYTALEVAGWGGWWWYRHDAGRLRDQSQGVAGVPSDPASGWSFERWAEATQGDPGEIAALYAVDPEAFYTAIASDPRFLAGWVSDDARSEFGALRIRSDSRLGRSRLFSTGLWLNHLVSAINALRAARFHNMPLSRQVGLRLDGDTRGVRVAVERRF